MRLARVIPRPMADSGFTRYGFGSFTYMQIAGLQPILYMVQPLRILLDWMQHEPDNVCAHTRVDSACGRR